MRASILTQKRARAPRRNLTQPERLLWSLLRRNHTGRHFRRQHPLGPYILHFYCASARLCVELDGPVHGERADHDGRRDAWLAAQGIRTLRFPVEAVELHPAMVLAAIAAAAAPPPASAGPPPPLRGGGCADCAVGTPLPFTGEGDHAKRGGGGGHRHNKGDAVSILANGATALRRQ